MVIESARRAAGELSRPAFRKVLFQSVGLTILMFFAAWIGIEYLFSTFLAPSLGNWPWVTTAIFWLLGAGVFVGAGFLLAPVTALFAGIFLDDAAEHVEKTWYGIDAVGTAVPLTKSLWLTLRFTLLVIFANLVALLLVLLPGINLAIFFLVNGYLLGREYFMFAAMRYLPEEEAEQMRSHYSTEILIAGFIIAGFMSIPLINLATPVFGAAMMVHLHKALSEKSAHRRSLGNHIPGKG